MSFRTANITNQLKTNLCLLIEHELLNKGFYDVISVDETDYLSNELSTFFPLPYDPIYAARTRWQAPKGNWVHETDITVAAGAPTPSLPSGVWINGTFYAPSDSTYGHVFNYVDGQVIFTSGTLPASNATVQVNYATKDIVVGLTSNDLAHALHNDYFDNDGIGDDVFPSGLTRAPSIWIECAGGEVFPKALGGNIIVRKNVHLHCVANDFYRDILDDIADRMMYLQYKKFNLIDVDKMPELLDYRGSKTATYRTFTDMEADSTMRYRGAYCLHAQRVDLFSERKDWNRVRIDMVWEIIGVPV